MEQAKANELKERILFEAQAQKLSCKEAFSIASEVGCQISEVGKTCNEMNIKIVGCQLGCF